MAWGLTMILRKRHATAIALLVGVACLGLAACVQDGRGGSSPTTATPGFALFYTDEGSSAKLAYGAPNSDDVGLMMECTKGSRMIEVSDVARTGAAQTLVLASGGQTTKLPATPSSGDGAPLLVAHARSDAAPLQSFKRSGRIDVAYGASAYGIAANPSEQVGIKRFFAACDRGA